MEELKIHSGGQKDHITALMDKYAKLKESLKRNPKLSEEEKQIELKKMNKKYRNERKDSNQKFY